MKKLLTTLSLLPLLFLGTVKAGTIASAKSIEEIARVNTICIKPLAIITSSTNICNPGANAKLKLVADFSTLDSIEILNKGYVVEWSTVSGSVHTTLGLEGFSIETPYVSGNTIYSVRVIKTGDLTFPFCYTDISISVSDPVKSVVSNVTGSETCGKTSINLIANQPLSGSEVGKWKLLSADDGNILGGIITDPNLFNSEFSGKEGVTYTLQWKINNLGCSDSAVAKVTFNKNPKAAVDGDITGKLTCGISSLDLNAKIASNGDGKWKLVSGANGVIFDTLDPKSKFSGDSGTTYKLRWIVESKVCGKDSADLRIELNLNPSNPNAGTSFDDFGTCGLTNVGLEAEQPKVGKGKWSIVSGTGGSFVNDLDPKTSFNGKPEEKYILAWIASNSPCDSRQDTIVVKFRKNPEGSASFDNPCGSKIADIRGTVLAGTGVWVIPSNSNNPVIGDVNNSSTTLSGDLGQTYNVIWKVENAPCSPKVIELAIKLRSNPTKPVVNDDYICIGSTKVLKANTSETGLNFSWDKIYLLKDKSKDTTVSIVDASTDELAIDYNSVINDDTKFVVWVGNVDNCYKSDTALVSKAKNYSFDLSSTLCYENGLLNKLLPINKIPSGTYIWKDEKGKVLGTDTSIYITGTGKYTLEIEEPKCGYKKFDFTINAYPQAKFKISALDSICLGTNLDLAANKVIEGTPKYKYYWHIGTDTNWTYIDTLSTATLKPNRIVDTVTLHVVDKNGCVSTDSKIVHAVNWDLKAPNIFTPNLDNKNDFFMIRKAPNTTVHIEFYNRWGEQMYKSDDYNNEWDAGGPNGAPDGVYYYTMEPSCPQGAQKGWVQIVR